MASTLELTLVLLGRKCEICGPGQTPRSLMHYPLWLHRQRLWASQKDKSGLGRTNVQSLGGVQRKRRRLSMTLSLSIVFCRCDSYSHSALGKRDRASRRFSTGGQPSSDRLSAAVIKSLD